MATWHVGGEHVSSGIYWNSRSGEFVSVDSREGRLAGGREDRYLRAPLPFVLIVGPLMGLAFVVLIPFSGLVVLLPFLAGKARGALLSRRVSAAHIAAPQTQPGVSFLEPRLASRPSSSPDGGEAEEQIQNGKLLDLASEIAQKRWRGR